MKYTQLTLIRVVFALFAGVYLSACTSADVRQSSGSNLRGIRVSTVSVIPDASLRSDDLAFIREKQVEDALTAAIRRRLSDTGKLQQTGATLAVKILSLRVRSTATAVMFGVMAGSDHLDANVSVVEKGQTIKTFVAEGSRTSGAFAGPGSGGRVERLCEELAIAIVGQL